MIKVEGLTKIFDQGKNNVVALQDISFEIQKGDIYSIVGRTGSGKSTLLNLLLGVMMPTEGKIIIDNKIIINKKTRKKMLRSIIDVELCSFQYPDHQLFNKTVEEEILLDMDKKDEMFKIMKQLNLSKNLLEENPFKLSSGEKRKVILTSLMLKNPSILLLDEPTSFLDPQSRVEFVQLIKKINQIYNTTILFVSHNINDVKHLGGKTILLEKGFLKKMGDTKKVLKSYGENNG